MADRNQLREWVSELIREHECLTSRAATGVNNEPQSDAPVEIAKHNDSGCRHRDLACPCRRKGDQSDLACSSCFGGLLRFRFSGQDLRQQDVAHIMPVRNNFERVPRITFRGIYVGGRSCSDSNRPGSSLVPVCPMTVQADHRSF